MISLASRLLIPTLTAAGLASPAPIATNTPDLSQVRLDQIVYQGTGCGSGSVAGFLAPGHESYVTIQNTNVTLFLTNIQLLSCIRFVQGYDIAQCVHCRIEEKLSDLGENKVPAQNAVLSHQYNFRGVHSAG